MLPAASAARPSGNPGPPVGRVAKRVMPPLSASAGDAQPIAKAAARDERKLGMRFMCDLREWVSRSGAMRGRPCRPAGPMVLFGDGPPLGTIAQPAAIEGRV